MRHNNDGLSLRVETEQRLDDLIAGRCVQVSRRLIGEDDVGIVRKRPGDGDDVTSLRNGWRSNI